MKEQIRTPLGKARGLGSAKEGVHHWWMQRVTSIIIAPVALYFLFHLGHMLPAPEGYANLVVFLGAPLTSAALLLGIAAGFYHACLGVQVIVEDYVHHEGAKTACLMANILFFAGLGVFSALSVLQLAFTYANWK